MLSAAGKGEFAICGANSIDEDPNNDPVRAAWGIDREIRAELIRWLCTDAEATKEVDPRGVRVYGARISGELNLSYVTVPFPLFLYRCRLTADSYLQYVRLPSLHLAGTVTKSLNLDSADIKGDAFLASGFAAEGPVHLRGARIGGNLECGGGTFENGGGDALSADRIEVKGNVFLNNGFTANGEVRFLSARIGGSLECGGGIFRNPGGDALSADRAEIKGHAFLNNDFSAEGDVRLLCAQIGGDLDCSHGTFSSPGSLALTADGVEVREDVFFDNGFSAEGEVRLPGAKIGGDLLCSNGRFRNSGGLALSAERSQINGNAVFLEGFSAQGEVRLERTEVGGNLDCSGGVFRNPGKDALNAQNATIGGSVFIRKDFSAAGKVNMAGAQIKRELELAWEDTAHSKVVDLSGSSAGSLRDDEASWPRKGDLRLDGFVYGTIQGGPTDARSRLDWLDRQAEMRPQPYRQLAQFLRGRGDSKGAKQVLFEMENRLRAEQRDEQVYSPLRWVRAIKDAVVRRVVGYGIYPGRALWLLAPVVALGWVVYGHARYTGIMAPTSNEAYKEFHSNGGHPPAYYQPFNPLIYSLENSVPLARFGQSDHWQPDPVPQPRAPQGSVSRVKYLLFVKLPYWRFYPSALRGLRWFMIGAGWLVVFSFVVAIARSLKAE